MKEAMEEVKSELVKIIEPYSKLHTNTTLPKLDPSVFKDGIDLKMMYQDIYLASEGYLYQMQHKGPIDIDKVISDYKDLIGFWKKMYLK